MMSVNACKLFEPLSHGEVSSDVMIPTLEGKRDESFRSEEYLATARSLWNRGPTKNWH